MSKQFKTTVELKGIEFDVVYKLIDSDIEGQMEVHLDSIQSEGQELDLTYEEEQEIREDIKENHVFEQRANV